MTADPWWTLPPGLRSALHLHSRQFCNRRLIGRRATIRDSTGMEYAGRVLDITPRLFILAGGNGSTVFVARGGNVVSIVAEDGP